MSEITREQMDTVLDWIQCVAGHADSTPKRLWTAIRELSSAWEREQERIAHPLVEMKDGALCCCNCGRRIEEVKDE